MILIVYLILINVKLIFMTNSTFQKSFLITCSQGFLFMFLVSMWFVYTPVLFDYINITKTQYGLTGVIFGVANIFTNQIATRFLIPKIGTTNALALSRGMFALIPFLIFFFSNLQLLFLFSLFWGMAIGIQSPSMFTQIAILEEKTNKILNPIFKASIGLGTLLGAVFSSWCLAFNFNPTIVFLGVGTLIIFSILAVIIFGLPRNFDYINESPNFTLPSRKVFLFAVNLMIWYAIIGIILNWSSVWLVEDLLTSIYLAGFIVIFFQFGEISGNLAGGKLLKKYSDKVVGPYFSIIGATILFLSIVNMNIYLIFFSVMVFGFLTSNIIPIVYRRVVKVSDEPVPVIISHISSISFAGIIFGPALTGFSADLFGLTFNMYALCISVLILSINLIIIMNLYAIKKS